MIQIFAIRSRGMYSGSTPVRDPKYLAYIRRQPSVVSGLGPCQACHTGPHAGNQKASDLDAIPLTWKEHIAYGKAPYAYAKAHGLDIPALIRRFNEFYLGIIYIATFSD